MSAGPITLIVHNTRNQKLKRYDMKVHSAYCGAFMGSGLILIISNRHGCTKSILQRFMCISVYCSVLFSLAPQIKVTNFCNLCRAL